MKSVKKTLVLYLIFFCLPLTVISQQTEFEKGYKFGYTRGYCYTSDKNSLFCNPPVFTPNAPFPIYPENSNSFEDGNYRGFLDGRRKRDQEDRNKTNKNNEAPYVPKFTPYIPQNPLANLTLEQYFQYRQMKEYRQQQLAQGIAGLIEVITYKSPEERFRIAQQQAIREQENEMIRAQRKVMLDQKRLTRTNQREAKRLIIGSEKYLECKKSWRMLLGGVLITSAAGLLCIQKGNTLASQYSYATQNAANLRKSGNLFYMAGPALFVASGYFTLKFSGKSHKLLTSKKPY